MGGSYGKFCLGFRFIFCDGKGNKGHVFNSEVTEGLLVAEGVGGSLAFVLETFLCSSEDK